MASRQDALKIAQADIETVGNHLATARRGRALFHDPVDEARQAVRLLERNARRLRQAFGLNGKE